MIQEILSRNPQGGQGIASLSSSRALLPATRLGARPPGSYLQPTAPAMGSGAVGVGAPPQARPEYMPMSTSAPQYTQARPVNVGAPARSNLVGAFSSAAGFAEGGEVPTSELWDPSTGELLPRHERPPMMSPPLEDDVPVVQGYGNVGPAPSSGASSFGLPAEVLAGLAPGARPSPADPYFMENLRGGAYGTAAAQALTRSSPR